MFPDPVMNATSLSESILQMYRRFYCSVLQFESLRVARPVDFDELGVPAVPSL